ncbi:Restriction endonuclease type II-like protein [Corchorus olitorius]|uniref:Restriction endonuclease type II-like protein n=1 Tax=Corchorus olitorius TaxID=93759 RepID=A0A1R3GY47_9ROSI|nr:Restriction endonuclease type II-like protein [Corchorus olitorius]
MGYSLPRASAQPFLLVLVGTCEELAYFIPLSIQLSPYSSRNIHKIGLLVSNLKLRRTCSSQNLFEPVNEKLINSSQNLIEPLSEKLISSSQYLNHPSQKGSRQSSIYQKFAPAENYSFLQSSSLQHWFKNWQELRKKKLTASTFSGAIGFWPRRRAQLWLEKLGAIEPFSGNLATCWSNIKEEEALERYKLITGNTVAFPEFQVYGKMNPEDSWLAASPDGLVDTCAYGLSPRGVLEIKCPFFGGDMSKAFPWKRIPLYCIPQAQGLMEIMDRDWMDFYVWTPKGSSLFRIYRDVEYWDVLKLALSDFWWKHVQPAKEICSSDFGDPLARLIPSLSSNSFWLLALDLQ